MPPIINNFWIAANIIFDLETGKTTQVLMLVSREADATIFNEKDAVLYLGFVERRATHVKWRMEKSRDPVGMFVIRGEQNV
jgi:hypothetical protein